MPAQARGRSGYHSTARLRVARLLRFRTEPVQSISRSGVALSNKSEYVPLEGTSGLNLDTLTSNRGLITTTYCAAADGSALGPHSRRYTRTIASSWSTARISSPQDTPHRYPRCVLDARAPISAGASAGVALPASTSSRCGTWAVSEQCCGL